MLVKRVLYRVLRLIRGNVDDELAALRARVDRLQSSGAGGRGVPLDPAVRQLDISGVDPSPEYTADCLRRVTYWFLEHQKRQPDNGVTSAIAFRNGKPVLWGSYPEVTGYIIPSLFDYARDFDDTAVFDAAVLATEFELSMQDGEGWFPGGYVGNLTGPSCFNSGQIIFGLLRAHEETGREDFLQSAVRAADWLCAMQNPDGAWRKYNYADIARTYDSTLAWALLEMHRVTGTEAYAEHARKSLDWVLSNQAPNGWFHNCDNSVDRNETPLTHTIGYTGEGLLRCYLLCGDERLLESARRLCLQLLHAFELLGKPLPGRLDSEFRGAVGSTCLTGNAQISICWQLLYSILGDTRYLNAALKMNDFLKTMQYVHDDPVISGSLPSSWPEDGDYFPNHINSWGPKYYADALLLEHANKLKLLEESK